MYLFYCQVVFWKASWQQGQPAGYEVPACGYLPAIQTTRQEPLICAVSLAQRSNHVCSPFAPKLNYLKENKEKQADKMGACFVMSGIVMSVMLIF